MLKHFSTEFNSRTGNSPVCSAAYFFAAFINSFLVDSYAFSLDLINILPIDGIAINEIIPRSIITASNSTNVKPFFIKSPLFYIIRKI